MSWLNTNTVGTGYLPVCDEEWKMKDFVGTISLLGWHESDVTLVR